MADQGRVCTALHARCCMPLDALMRVVLACPISGGWASLGFPPTGILPRAAARQKRQRASRTSYGSSFVRTLHARGGLSAASIQRPTPPAMTPTPGLKLSLMMDVELRSGGKRRRCALQLRRRTKSMLGCWVLNPSAGHEHKQDSVLRARLSSRLALDRLVIVPPQPTCCSDRVFISVTIACRSMTVTLRLSPGAQGVLSIPDRDRDIISAVHA